MALATVSGVSCPVAAGTSTLGQAPGTGQTTGSTLAVLAGDRIVVAVTNTTNTASVSSITNSGTALTWTRLGSITTQGTNRFEFWYSSANVAFQNITVTVNMSASVTWQAALAVVTGFPGVPETPVYTSGSSTAPAGNGPISTQANSLLLWVNSNVTNSSSGIQWSNPPGSGTIVSSGVAVSVTLFGPGLTSMPGVPSATPKVVGNTITTGVWFVAGVSVPGPTIQIDDYALQLRDDNTGVLLNDPNDITVPLYDVNQVTGLDDGTINYSSSEIDGAHGSYVAAKFLTGKTVVVDGVLYTNPPVDETLVDALKLNWRPAPSPSVVPFFFKKPNKSVRWISAKPINFTCDLTRQRSLGIIPFQAQFAAPDPRAYSLPVMRIQTTATSGSQYDDSPTVGGNIETYPIIYFNVYSSEIGAGSYTIGNLAIPIALSPFYLQLTVTAATLTAGAYALDFGARTLTKIVSGADFSAAITTRNWWYLVPGAVNNVRFTRIGGVTTDGFAMSYADAWR